MSGVNFSHGPATQMASASMFPINLLKKDGLGFWV